jgi:hypothetical protein
VLRHRQREARERLAAGETQCSVARSYNVSQATISRLMGVGYDEHQRSGTVPEAMFFAYLASALAIMLVLIFAFKVEERFSVTGLATLALAISTIFLAWDAHQQLPILSGQLDEMKKAYDLTTKAVGVADKTANAAIEANNLTRQTFVAGQRPWVIYDYLATKITSPLILDTQSDGRMELEIFGKKYRANDRQKYSYICGDFLPRV